MSKDSSGQSHGNYMKSPSGKHGPKRPLSSNKIELMASRVNGANKGLKIHFKMSTMEKNGQSLLRRRTIIGRERLKNTQSTPSNKILK